MAPLKRPASLAIAASLGLLLAGCASDVGTMFGATTTASIPEKPKVDPACVTLTSQIDTLRKEGIAEKVEKAAIKKYKMTTADLSKAAQLNKANAEFQEKCSANAITTAMVTPTTTGAVPANEPRKQGAGVSAAAAAAPSGQ